MSDIDEKIRSVVKKCFSEIVNEVSNFNTSNDLRNQLCADIIVTLLSYYISITVDGDINDKFTLVDEICQTVKTSLENNIHIS